jgi:hypothetical protein
MAAAIVSLLIVDSARESYLLIRATVENSLLRGRYLKSILIIGSMKKSSIRISDVNFLITA